MQQVAVEEHERAGFHLDRDLLRLVEAVALGCEVELIGIVMRVLWEEVTLAVRAEDDEQAAVLDGGVANGDLRADQRVLARECRSRPGARTDTQTAFSVSR
jgi:hypothetical protein